MSERVPNTLATLESPVAAPDESPARARARLKARIRERRAHIRHTLSNLEDRIERRLEVAAEIPRKVAHAGRVGATAVVVGTTVLALAFFVRAMVKRFVAVGTGNRSRSGW